MNKSFKKLSWLVTSLLLLMIILIGCSSETSNEQSASDSDNNVNSDNNNNDTNVEVTAGGDLEIALSQQPPILDPQITTNTHARDISRHVVESLLVLDSEYEVQPMLAESYEESDDGLTYTFYLREGVKFHNGQEMTAEDVVASLNRWLEVSSRAANVIGDTQFEEVDEYTVQLEMEESVLGVLDVIAASMQISGIMPKETIENAPDDGINEIVGTGPYKFVEWVPDQYIKLEKYDEYQPMDTPSDGLAGKKEALVDSITFQIVVDGSTRLGGLTTGQYDFAYDIPYDNYDQIENSPEMDSLIGLHGGLVFAFNKQEGVFAYKKLRQAANIGINNEDILYGGLGNEDFYRIDAGLMYVDQQKWYTDAGSEHYFQNDKERARQLVEESDYNGEEVVILTFADIDHFSNAAVVMREELEDIGFNVSIQTLDAATLFAQREDPSVWEMFTMGYSPVSLPTQLLGFDPNGAGWPVDETLQQFTEDIRTAESDEEGLAIWEEMQEYAWGDYVSYIKTGDFFVLHSYRGEEVQGVEFFEGLIFWNASLSE